MKRHRTFNILIVVFAATIILSVGVGYFALGEHYRKREQPGNKVEITVLSDTEKALFEPADKSPAEDAETPDESIKEASVSVPPIETLISAGHDYSRRRKAFAEMIRSGLTANEIVALTDYLLSESSNTQEPMWEFALRNDVLREFIEGGVDLSVLTKILIEVPRNTEKHHPMWREFVLQSYSTVVRDYGIGLDHEETRRLKQALLERLAETESGIAGTALINFHRLDSIMPEFSDGVGVEEKRLEIMLDADVDLSSRISAIATLQDQSVKQEISRLTALLETEDTHVLVKAAALRRVLDAYNHLPNVRSDVSAIARGQNSPILNRILLNEESN